MYFYKWWRIDPVSRLQGNRLSKDHILNKILSPKKKKERKREREGQYHINKTKQNLRKQVNFRMDFSIRKIVVSINRQPPNGDPSGFRRRSKISPGYVCVFISEKRLTLNFLICRLGNRRQRNPQWDYWNLHPLSDVLLKDVHVCLNK